MEYLINKDAIIKINEIEDELDEIYQDDIQNKSDKINQLLNEELLRGLYLQIIN